MTDLNSKETYRDNPLLKKVGVDLKFTKEQVEEYICQLEEADYDYDGQPDELTEWMDFDPDC